ncbi:hypothetical protein [Geoalkalibacter halelectricus]
MAVVIATEKIDQKDQFGGFTKFGPRRQGMTISQLSPGAVMFRVR